jgi:hypothetical protein
MEMIKMRNTNEIIIVITFIMTENSRNCSRYKEIPTITSGDEHSDSFMKIGGTEPEINRGWLIEKRDSLRTRINGTTNEEVKVSLELLWDLYSYLIEADGNFSENLKFQFVEDKLTLYPTADGMLKGHTQISTIIAQIKCELRDELKSGFALIERKLNDVEGQQDLIISGQNELLSTHQKELPCIHSKLDQIHLLIQQNAIEMTNQITQINQTEEKVDKMGLAMARVQEDLRSIEKMITYPLLTRFFVVVGVVGFLYKVMR